MIINPEEVFNNPFYKFVTNKTMWEVVIGLAIIYFILFKFKLFNFVVSIFFSIYDVIKKIVVNVYVHFLLLAYERKSGVDMSEYRKNVECDFRGVKCRHITNADIIVIEHLRIFKPLILFFFFIHKICEKFRRKRIDRIK